MPTNLIEDGGSNPEISNIVYDLIPSPNFTNDGILFAGRQSGMIRSENGGETWTDALTSLHLEAELPILAGCVSPEFPKDPAIFAGAPGGVLRSIDSGNSWEVAMLQEPVPVISCMAISPNFIHDGIIFAGTVEDGVFYTKDRGGRWVAWNFGLLDLNVLCLVISPDFVEDETVFVGVESGVFRSTNGGRAWRETQFPIDQAPVLSLHISSDYTNDGNLFAGTEENGMFVSHDWGMSWEQIDNIPADEPINAITGHSSNIFAVGSSQIHHSHDKGKSWRILRMPKEVSEYAISTCIAPSGSDDDEFLVLGLINGKIIKAPISN